MERLDKIISSQRADGRKEVQKLIKSGAVLVNGKICKKPDAKVDPEKDEIVVDGTGFQLQQTHIYNDEQACGSCVGNRGQAV